MMRGKGQVLFIVHSGRPEQIRRSPCGANIKSRNQTCWTLRISRQYAFTRVTLFNGRVKSRAHALVTQRAAAACHPDHHYDRPEDVTVQKHSIFDGQSTHTMAILLLEA